MLSVTEPIVAGHLVLRALHPDDADEMVEVLRDDHLHEFTGGRPLTLDELRRRYHQLAVGRSQDGSQTWLNWIVRLRDSDAAVGTVQATITGVHGSEHAQIAWVVGVPWQRKGIGTQATLAMMQWLEQSGVRTFSANIHPGHTASQKIALRAGLLPTEEILDGEQVWRRPETPAVE